MRIRRRLALLVAAALCLPAMAHAVPRRGGEGVTTTSPSRSGFTVPYARVIVGDTLEIWRNGGRVGIGLIGMDAAEGNTRCGVKATRRLDRLVAGGITFKRQPGRQYDGRLRRMYYGLTPDGTSIALRMVRLGLAYAVAEGRERRALAAAERSARAEGRGCLWRRSGHTALAESLEIPRGVATSPDLSPELRAAAPEALVPTGFTEQVVASGLNLPTAFTELPDGRILVAEKPGLVRVIKNGQVLPTPFIDIRAQVNDYWDRGLVGIAADPDFASNGYVYLYFTYENNATNYEGPKTARLIRVTASGDAAPLASATVILGTTVGTSCNNFAPGTDCIPTDGPGHSTGDIEFASDGTMFVSVGDGAHWNAVVQDALRAQNLDLLAGKLLHITKTGKGVPSNPFWNGNADANRSKVYAYGLRNSYRGGLRPGTNVPYFGDVGWGTREEVNVVTPGANLGWPCWEGTFKPAYQSQQTCVDLYAQGNSAVRFPLIEYPHSGTSAAATGGTFYTGTSFPSEYQGAYFYGDYARGWIKYIRVNASDGLVSGPTDLTTTAGAPVDIQEGSDGALYYISIYPGELRRICYGSCSSSPPPPSSSGYRAEVLSDNPLGYWRLGESSGTTAADASGNNRPGTYVGGPTLGSPGLQSSDADTSITVNGLTQRVEVPHAAAWNLTGDLTIEALVNVTGGDNYRTIVAKHDANGDVPVYEFRIQALNNRLQFVQKTTAGTFLSITGNTTLAVGTTYHVAVTKSGSTVTLYVNGAVDKTQTFSGTIATNTKPVTFGRRDGSKALAGRIDEVAIYGKALTASRIAAHRAAATSPGQNQPPAPTISSPTSSTTFAVGDVIQYSGSASDAEDGTIPASGLSWDIRLHHCTGTSCHIHPFLQASGSSGSFTIPDHGPEGVFFELVLKATDSDGATGTTSVSIQPRTTPITINTSPAGLDVFFGERSATAPLVVDGIVGSSTSISVADQGVWQFDHWSDGGARTHTITVGTSPATYTAFFVQGQQTGAYPAEVLADQPLGYWRLGESSGTTAADASGNNRPGTYVGGPTLGSPGLQSSDADTSITVNGLTQRVEVPHAAVWNLTGDLTIEALVNVTGGDNYRTIVAKHDANGDVPVFEFRIQAVNNRLQFVQKTTAGTFLSITGNTTLAVGTTYHVAVTKSGSTVTLYVNGAVDKTQTFSGTIATNSKPVTFGRRDGSKALAGRIDEVAIYGTALSASRIAAHHAAA